MKYTNLPSSVSSKFSRKIIRSVNKRNAENLRRFEDSDPNELSSDSGLGLDHQLEVQLATRDGLPYSTNNSVNSTNGVGLVGCGGKSWCADEPDVKRKRFNYQFDTDDVNDEFCFPNFVRGKSGNDSGIYSREKIGMPGRGRGVTGTPVTLSTPLNGSSRDGKSQLLIVCQPEQQHRARYQTEGSRGAVKDRTGNGFPVVKLAGYNKPTTLQIFIGTDVGRVTPHMFYQACRVSGKNSTPCVERKVDGTVVIEVDLDPSKDMVITCDCVGILKERNVDVEHRFPDQTGTRNKKKSTRCRMVFRTTIANNDGSTEVLQVCSHPIVCTQPPGVPEICKKSLTSCPATGGAELFILGKNFLKDTKVIFQQTDLHPPWEETVSPDKEFLQQTHLICVIPPYRSVDIMDPVTVKIFVTSSGKASDPHTFVYLPAGSPIVPSCIYEQFKQAVALADSSPCSSYLSSPLSQAFVNGNRVFAKASNIPSILPSSAPLMKSSTMKPSYFDAIKKDVHSVPLMWPPPTKPEATEEEEKMMPPPPALIPITRRPSVTLMMSESEAELKTEIIDEVSQHSVEHDQSSLSPSDMQGVDLSMKTPLLRHLVDIPPVTIGSLGVDKYFPKSDPPKSSYAVYDSDQQRQFLEEDLLRPSPAKIQALEFSVNAPGMAPFTRGQCSQNTTVIHSAVAMNQSPQTDFEGNASGRSENFAGENETPITESPVGGFDGYPRVRMSNLPPNYDPSNAYEPRSNVMRVYDSEPPPMVLSNDCSIDSAISSVVKQAVREMESEFYCQATTPATSSMTQVTSNSTGLNSLVCPDLIAPTAQTRNLDDFVNSAADTHISPKSEPFMPTASVSQQTMSVEGDRSGDSFNARYQSAAHNLLPPQSNELSSAGSGVKEPQSLANDAGITESRSNAFDGLVTSQILTKSDKMDDTSSSAENCLNTILTGPNTSPMSQSNGFRGTTIETKTTLGQPETQPTQLQQAQQQQQQASLPQAQSAPRPQSPVQNKDVSYSTKQEVESEMTSRIKSLSMPLAIKEMSESSQKMGEMFVPVGPAPPITGMVPQEMVKMTDNDLISYINPSCFDQG
ncbi:hypothetical protein RUM43_008545 [Polyplax serrata]|uniref:Nuclear factor of activated T-cells 5 n=1 Tax=Polyplax serrata TaxID=468196 RepID=A0AAN8PG18_POLSC